MRSGAIKIVGFTLMEVMLALVIFAILAMALSRHSSEMLSAAGAIKGQVQALELAEAELNRELARPGNSSLGERDYPRKINAVDYQVKVLASSTPNPLLARIVVEVRKQDEENFVLASLVGFKENRQ